MVRILEQENTSRHFTYEKLNEISSVRFEAGQPSKLKLKNGTEVRSSCIICKDTACMISGTNEVVLDELQSSQKHTKCPTDAIQLNDDNFISINQDMCIKCGLCIQSCPIGAIYIDNNSNFTVNNDRKVLIEAKRPIKINKPIHRSNQPIGESDKLLSELIVRIKNHPQRGAVLNSLTSKLLQEMGMDTYLTRQGDVNLRMDGLAKYGSKYFVIEIELSADLDAPRNILDDVAVFSSRYKIPKDHISGLIVLAELPNKRTEYWELIYDIEKVIDLKIFNVPLAALLTLLWADKKLQYHHYKLNNRLTSSREALESSLGRTVNISNPSNLIEAAK